MAWDSLFSGGSTKKTVSGWGGLFDNTLSQQQIDQKVKERDYQAQAQLSAREAEHENSNAGIAKNTAVDFGHKLIQVPVDFAKDTFGIYQQTLPKVQGTVTQAIGEVKNAIKKPSINTPSQIGASVAKAGLRNAGDIVAAVFAPISGAIGAVLKMTGGQQLIDTSGNVVADKSGITDVPAFQKFAMAHPNAGEDFNRLLNLVMAGAAGKGKINPEEVRAQSEIIAHKLVADNGNPPRETPPGMVKLPVKGTSVETPVENNLRYTGPEDLPTIEAGSTPRSPLPTIQTEASTPGTGSYSYEPIAQSKSPWESVFQKEPDTTTSGTLPSSETTTSNQAPAVARSPLPEAQNVAPEQAINTRAEKLYKAAVEKKLVSDYGNLPTHDKLDMKVQASKAVDLVNRDESLARDIISHKTLPPGGLLPEDVYTALEIKAMETGDVGLIDELSRSQVPTLAGQGLKALDSSDPLSPVKIVRDVRSAFEDRAAKRYGSKANKKDVSEMDAAIRKQPSAAKWDSFIKEITCNS